MSTTCRPLNSLKEGHWFKLICGASYQHLPAIRNLALVYALAGADCIDVAADPAVVAAVREALQVFATFRYSAAPGGEEDRAAEAEPPLLMVSVSDGEDPHFRKATFAPQACPTDCSRPCETICPAAAIAFSPTIQGVITDRCYGCGRCLPVCPLQHIATVTRATPLDAIAPQLFHQVDAIEIHTQVGRYDAFMKLWATIRPYLSRLRLISISCLDQPQTIDYLWQLYQGMQPLDLPLIWQTDGRSMSGDIGKGTTHATVRFATQVLQAGPPGFVQLAGGTNDHTVSKMATLTDVRYTRKATAASTRSLDQAIPQFGGIAYGSFARQLMAPFLEEVVDPLGSSASTVPMHSPNHAANGPHHLENYPTQLNQAIQVAQSLIVPLKAATLRPMHRRPDPVNRSCSAIMTDRHHGLYSPLLE